MPKDIFKRGSTWYTNVWDRARKTKVKRAVGPNKRKAEEVAAQLRAKMLASDLGLPLRRKVPTLDEFVPRFLAQYEGKQSLSYAKRALANFRKFSGNLRLTEINKGLLERYRTKRLNDPIAPPFRGRSAGAASAAGWTPCNGRKVGKATVNRETTFLMCMTSRALEWGEIEANPLAGFKRFPEKGFARTKYLQVAEMVASLRAAASSKNKHLHDIILLALYLGRRKGDLLRRRRQDYDELNGMLFLGRTKKGEEEHVPMPAAAQKVLERLCKKAAETGVDWLFPNRKGTGPITSVRTAWLVACRRAGLSGVRFHDLRHTAISYMIMSGVDYHTIAALVGHTSPTMIEKRYGHLSREHKRASSQIFGVHMDCLLGTGPGLPTSLPAEQERSVVAQVAELLSGRGPAIPRSLPDAV